MVLSQTKIISVKIWFSAGLKIFPPIIVTPRYDGTSTLTKLFKYQNVGKSLTGWKRTKADSEISAPNTIDKL